MVYPADTSHAPVVTELKAPSGVEASYVPLTMSIGMSWTPGEGISRQMVVVLDSDFKVEYFKTVPATATVHDITQTLDPGMYTVYVLSISGSDFEYDSDTVEVPGS